jgi:hypothetical protein
MQTATKPLVVAHVVPFARRAVLVPEAHRRPGSARRTSKVGSSTTSTTTTTTTTNLSEANGPATSTVARPDLHFDLNQTVELRATVTVNMKNFWLKEDMLDRVFDGFHNFITQNWLYLELVSSELDPSEKPPLSLLLHALSLSLSLSVCVCVCVCVCVNAFVDIGVFFGRLGQI